MNRRDFLRSALAGAMVVAMPTLAAATIQAAVTPIPFVDPNQHIIDALRLYDEFLAAGAKSAGRKAFTGTLDQALNDEMHHAFDRMFEHIFATFKHEKTEETFLVVRDMLRGENPIDEAKLRKVPPVVIESAWPVAMVKIILRDRAMPINHRQLKTFKRFHDTYGDYILSDSWNEIVRNEANRKAKA